MDRSEQINEIAGALAKAQSQIGGAVKGAENPFFKSRYASLPDVMAACREPLSKNGIAVVQSIQFDGDQRWLETMLAHVSGQWIGSRYPVKPLKDDPQSLGSAISYARRYALAALVGVVSVDEDDDGESASGRGNGKAHADPTPDKSDRKSAATKWANDALAAMQSFKSGEEFTAWHRANTNAIAAVRGFNEALHGRLVAAIQKRHDDFNPLAAE